MKNNLKFKYVIIGAGPAGIGAAFNLKKRDIDNFTIIEREDRPGGLSRSFKDDVGFTWDIGGHVTFSNSEIFNNAIQDIEDKNSSRKPRIPTHYQ